MVLTLLATSLLSAASPEFSVVVARRLGVTPQVAAELAQQLAVALEAKDSKRLGKLLPPQELQPRLAAAGLPEPSVCNGASACVATLARVSGLTSLVALQIVKVGSNLALDLSVVETASGRSVASVTRTVKARTAASALDALATALVSELPPPLPVVEAVPEPAPPPEPVEQPVTRTIVAQPDTPTAPPEEVAAKEEAAPLRPPAPLHLAAYGVGDVVARKLGIEIGASYALLSRLDLGLSVVIGDYPGFRVTASLHTLIDDARLRPFAQLRVTIHPLPGGVAAGGGLYLGGSVELGPGRIVAGALGELYAGPAQFHSWVVGPMAGYEVDLFRPDAPAP